MFSLRAELGRRLEKPAPGRWGKAHRSCLLDFSPPNNLSPVATKRMGVCWYNIDYGKRNLRCSWSVKSCMCIFLTQLFRRLWGCRCWSTVFVDKSPLLKHRLTKVKPKNQKAKISYLIQKSEEESGVCMALCMRGTIIFPDEFRKLFT